MENKPDGPDGPPGERRMCWEIYVTARTLWQNHASPARNAWLPSHSGLKQCRCTALRFRALGPVHPRCSRRLGRFSESRLASSSQAAYHSPRHKCQGSLTPLLVLSPEKRFALSRGPRFLRAAHDGSDALANHASPARDAVTVHHSAKNASTPSASPAFSSAWFTVPLLATARTL